MEGRHEGRDQSVVPPVRTEPSTDNVMNRVLPTGGRGRASPVPNLAMRTHGSGLSSLPAGKEPDTEIHATLASNLASMPHAPPLQQYNPQTYPSMASNPEVRSGFPPGDIHPAWFQTPQQAFYPANPPLAPYPPHGYNSTQPPWQHAQSAPPGAYGQGYYFPPSSWMPGPSPQSSYHPLSAPLLQNPQSFASVPTMHASPQPSQVHMPSGLPLPAATSTISTAHPPHPPAPLPDLSYLLSQPQPTPLINIPSATTTAPESSTHELPKFPNLAESLDLPRRPRLTRFLLSILRSCRCL